LRPLWTGVLLYTYSARLNRTPPKSCAHREWVSASSNAHRNLLALPVLLEEARSRQTTTADLLRFTHQKLSDAKIATGRSTSHAPMQRPQYSSDFSRELTFYGLGPSDCYCREWRSREMNLTVSKQWTTIALLVWLPLPPALWTGPTWQAPTILAELLTASTPCFSDRRRVRECLRVVEAITLQPLPIRAKRQCKELPRSAKESTLLLLPKGTTLPWNRQTVFCCLEC
jgi:hypothetical protein